jgi:transcriptional regulator with XRE-family HTH domain
VSTPYLRTLRELRLELGLTLKQVQERTGLHKATLSQIERGRLVASPHEATLISRALGFKLETRTVLVFEADPQADAEAAA